MFALTQATILRRVVTRSSAAFERRSMDEAAAATEVRVATLTLWGWRGVWEERRRVLVEGFRELQPDLVAFQEAVVTEGYD